MVPGLLKTMRPHQWVKNLFVLAPLIFAKELFDLPMAVRALIGLGAFCLLTSSVYVMNDLADVTLDRAHPIKKNRPIASGRVSIGVARVAALVLVAVSLGVGLWLGLPFVGCAAAYFVLNLAYSL